MGSSEDRPSSNPEIRCRRIGLRCRMLTGNKRPSTIRPCHCFPYLKTIIFIPLLNWTSEWNLKTSTNFRRFPLNRSATKTQNGFWRKWEGRRRLSRGGERSREWSTDLGARCWFVVKYKMNQICVNSRAPLNLLKLIYIWLKFIGSIMQSKGIVLKTENILLKRKDNVYNNSM